MGLLWKPKPPVAVVAGQMLPSFSSSEECAPTKSCPSDCDNNAAEKCGADKDYFMCSDKGDEYDPEEEDGNCCDYSAGECN